MIPLDVNVLVYAHRVSAVEHEQYREWLETAINSEEAYGLSDLNFVAQIRDQPNRVRAAPRQHRWDIFSQPCEASGARGSLVAVALLVAIAIEHGCE